MPAPHSVAEHLRDQHVLGLRRFRAGLSAVHHRFDRAGPTMITRDLTIPVADAGLPARLYQPENAGRDGPGVVFFHGGGFVICDLDTHDALCRHFAAAARMPVLSVEYRLAPESPFPTQIEDGEAATRWAMQEAAQLGFDPAQLILSGDSAGGYIALDVAARLNAAQPGTVAGLSLIYPLLELGDAAWASSVFSDSRVVGRIAVSYIRAQLRLTGPLPASLLDIEPSLIPPTVLALGGALDPCRPDGRRLADRLRAANHPLTVLEYSSLPHGFGSITHLSPASRRAIEEIGRRTAEMATG